MKVAVLANIKEDPSLFDVFADQPIRGDASGGKYMDGYRRLQ